MVSIFHPSSHRALEGYLIRKILRRSPKRCECRHGFFEEARDATRRITSPTQLDSSLAWLATMMPGIDLLGSGEGRVEQEGVQSILRSFPSRFVPPTRDRIRRPRLCSTLPLLLPDRVPFDRRKISDGKTARR